MPPTTKAITRTKDEPVYECDCGCGAYFELSFDGIVAPASVLMPADWIECRLEGEDKERPHVRLASAACFPRAYANDQARRAAKSAENADMAEAALENAKKGIVEADPLTAEQLERARALQYGE